MLDKLGKWLSGTDSNDHARAIDLLLGRFYDIIGEEYCCGPASVDAPTEPIHDKKVSSYRMDIIPQHTFSKKYTLNLNEQQRERRSRLQTNALIRKSQTTKEAYDANPNLCQSCGNPIPSRPDVGLYHVKIKKYCNSSCAAKANNLKTVAPKRKKPARYCKKCNELLPDTNRARYCDTCRGIHRDRMAKKTRAEAGKGNIGAHARIIMNGTPKVCINCTYSKAVQICHIRPVKDFPKTALVAEINTRNNLIYLCPNCHWEFDHGLLETEARHKLLTLDSNENLFT